MSRLDKLWADKIAAKKDVASAMRIQNYKPYTVQWDHPDFAKGEKTTRKTFQSLDDARNYAISIGLEYDLRRQEGEIPSLNPNLSRYKSGYSPMESESSIPYVMPCIQTQDGFPTEVSDQEVYLYKKKHGMPTVGRHIFKSHQEKD